jgi:hypothetical protein
VSAGLLAFSFPNPFNLLGPLLSPLLNLGREITGGIVEMVIDGLAGAVVGAVADLTASVLGFFWDAAEPQLTGSWFYGPDAPYWQMVLLAMPLLLAFFLAGIIQGVLRGDVAGMLRMALLRLPGSVLAMSMAVVLADVLLEVTDDMSATLLGSFRDDVEQVAVVLGRLALGGSTPMMMLILVFGAVGLLAAVMLIVELFVRAALLYLVAVFCPLVFAAAVWEPLRGGVRKLGEIAFALIISKLAIAAALAVSAAALVASWPGTEATAIPTPESAAAAADQSASAAVGTLVGAIVIWVVAAFMPFVLWRLLPLAEGAGATHGVRGAPFRGAHMTASAGMMAVNNPATAALRVGTSAGKAAAGAGAGVVAATKAGETAAASKGGGRRGSAAGSPAGGAPRRPSGGSGRTGQAGRRQGSAGPRTGSGQQASGAPQGRQRSQSSGRPDSSAAPGSGRRAQTKGRQVPGAPPGSGPRAAGPRSGGGRSMPPEAADAGPEADVYDDDRRRHEMGPDW